MVSCRAFRHIGKTFGGDHETLFGGGLMIIVDFKWATYQDNQKKGKERPCMRRLGPSNLHTL